MPCTRHRVFLAALIVAAKYLNDSSPKNKHWARYAALFPLAEVTLMEKQLLYLLDFDLRMTELELIRHFTPFLPRRHHRRARLDVPISAPSTPMTARAPSLDSCPSSGSSSGSSTSSPYPLTPRTPVRAALRPSTSRGNMKVSWTRPSITEAAAALEAITIRGV